MATKRVPNYGPGSISTVAKGRLAAMPKPAIGVTDRLLNAITKVSSGPKSSGATQIKNRIDQQDALKREHGGKR